MTEDTQGGELRCHAQLWDQVMKVKAHLGLRKVSHRGEMHVSWIVKQKHFICFKGQISHSEPPLLSTMLCCRRPASKSVWDTCMCKG